MTGFALTLLQICIIVLSGRAVGLLLKRLGQPSVIGEIAGGILLGPSAFGTFAPQTFARLFPAESIPMLLSLSQIGLILFMFLVGLEFAPELMRGKKHSVVVISHVSIIVPFLLGTALAFYLHPRVADPGVSFRSFTLFLGTAMSITAFPVLTVQYALNQSEAQGRYTVAATGAPESPTGIIPRWNWLTESPSTRHSAAAGRAYAVCAFA